VRQMIEKGLATPQESFAANGSAAEARAKLLERRRQAATEAGGDVIQSFNKELLTLSIDLRELKARQDYLQQRIAHLREASAKLEKMHEAEGEATDAEHVLGDPNRWSEIQNIPVGEIPPITVTIDPVDKSQPASN
jgi:hypothetical protein